MQTKRNRRRNRHRQVQALRRADERAIQLIDSNWWLSWATWGGNRCPDCGCQIRPYQLIAFGGLVGVPCHPGPCHEDSSWEDRAISRCERLHNYKLRMGVDDGWR
jgi:hypothetical protein